MSSSLPSFAYVAKRWKGEPAGLRKYVWQPKDGLACFVAFRLLDNEAFDAFGGWTTTGRYPEGETFTAATEKFNDFQAPGLVAWSMAFVPRTGVSYWSFWEPSEQARNSPALFGEEFARHFSNPLTADDARTLVRDKIALAIRELREFCVPYLEKRADYATA
jgi:hypothetical protein